MALPHRARSSIGVALALALAAACATDPEAKDGAPDPTSTAPPAAGPTTSATSTTSPPPKAPPDDDAPWSAGLEACGNEIDDDGDGLVDEECAPSFFIGVFPPGGGADLAGGGHVAKMEVDLGRPISVIQ